MSLPRTAICTSASLAARARSMSCMARVGTIVICCAGGVAADGLPTGPSILARRRPSVPTAVIVSAVELQLHAAEGVAAAFVVGGEDRAADQLAEQPGRDFVEACFAELGDRRELGGVLGGQLELAALAADGRALAVGFDVERLVGAFAEDASRSGRPAARPSRAPARRRRRRRGGCRLRGRWP